MSDTEKVDYALRGSVYAFLIAGAKEAVYGSYFSLVWCLVAVFALGLSTLVARVGRVK